VFVHPIAVTRSARDENDLRGAGGDEWHGQPQQNCEKAKKYDASQNSHQRFSEVSSQAADDPNTVSE
jgi:hypothetical protein